MALKIDIGNIISLHHKINQNSLRILEKILDDESFISKLALEFQDEKISFDLCKQIFHKELLYLFRWSKTRSIIERYAIQKLEISKALLLLPKHAFFIHIVRFALPFALTGIKTEVNFANSGREFVLKIAKMFNLEDFLFCSDLSPEKKFNAYNCKQNLIMLVGKSETALMLKPLSNASFFAATGRCSILVFDKKDSLFKISPYFQKITNQDSCTNFGASILKDSEKYYNYSFNGAFEYIEDIGDFIANLHPSCIFSDIENMTEFYGYNVCKVNTDGSVNNLKGFGKDPKFNFCGSYLM